MGPTGYDFSMTSLAMNELKKLRNPQSTQRIVPDTMRWAYKWLTEHNIYNIPQSSETSCSDLFRCDSSQQTLTQIVKTNMFQKNTLLSVTDLTSQELELLIQRHTKPNKSKTSTRRKKQRKHSHNQSHLKQTKLAWKTKCKTKQISKKHPNHVQPRRYCRQQMTTSKWNEFLDPSQLELMYPRRKHYSETKNLQSSVSATELKDFLIPAIKRHSKTQKRSLDTQNQSVKIVNKTPRLLNSRDCKTH